MLMLASLLDTKLDAKLNPLNTEIHVLRTNMEAMTGQMEALGTKVENLEIATESEFDDGLDHEEENGPMQETTMPARRTRPSAAAVLANHGGSKKNKVG